MKQVRAIIADDEEALRHSLKRKLAALWPDMIICGEAGDGVTALKLAQTLVPDIAFLDIKMPGLSGIEVARGLPGECLPVFITAYDEFAVKAFETGAIDYLITGHRQQAGKDRAKIKNPGGRFLILAAQFT
jgi:DNA-binding LytR/AlgR family response regulator